MEQYFTTFQIAIRPAAKLLVGELYKRNKTELVCSAESDYFILHSFQFSGPSVVPQDLDRGSVHPKSRPMTRHFNNHL